MTDAQMESNIIQVLEGIASLNTKVDIVQKDVDELKKITTQVNDHDQHLKSLDNTVQELNNSVKALATRVSALEQADGRRAANVLKTIGNYVLVAFAAGILSNLGNIINAIK